MIPNLLDHFSRFLVGAVFIVTLVLVAPMVQAQDFERYRPRSPATQEGESRLPDIPQEATGDTKVLVKELKAVIFVDHGDKVVKGKIQAEGIQIRSDSLDLLRSPAFASVIAPYLGKPVSIRRLNEIVREVIIFYRDNDLPVVDVSVPPQDVTDGVAQFVVTEGRVGQIYVQGTQYFNPDILVDHVSIYSGDPIYESQLLDDLRWLNRNPFRRVDLELERGSAFGLTDIIFNVEDEWPWRFYVGYEDTGTRATGLERTIYGVNWGNAFGLDHQAAYQFTASSDFSTLTAHSLVYSVPLYNRDTLMAYGSYSEISAPAGGPFTTNGIAWQTSLRYNRDLCPIECYDHRLVVGLDFKRTNSNLDFGGVSVFTSSADVAQIVIGYHGVRQEPYGSLSIGGDFYASPGGFSAGNNNIAFDVLRPGATAEYYYGRAYAEKEIELPTNLTFVPLSLVVRITGQLAEGNLLPTEQLGFGGYNSIRGFDMRTVNGDSGYIVNVEIRTDPEYLGLVCDDDLQFLVFYDIGEASNHTLLPGEDPSVDLSSVGVGLRYRMGRTLQLRADYGFQLNELTAGSGLGDRFHIGVVASY